MQAYSSIYLWDALKPRHHIKKQRHHFADKALSSQSYGFSSTCMDVRAGP